MKIAVIIPVYNQLAYLRQCLDSLTAQTDGDFIAVCVNDGSTDDSQSVIEEYAARDPRFRLVAKTNGGLSSARNAGMDRILGELTDDDGVMFLDSDDFLHPQCLEAVRRFSALRPGGVIEYEFSGSMSPAEFRARRYDLASVSPVDDCASDTVWNKLYPAGLIRGLRFAGEVRYSEDVVFTTELTLLKHPSFHRIPLCLHYYSENPDSMSRVRFTRENFRRRNGAVERLCRTFADDPRALEKLARLRFPSLLKRFYRDLRCGTDPGEYAGAREEFAQELARLRDRGLLRPSAECLKDFKYYLIFQYLIMRYAMKESRS